MNNETRFKKLIIISLLFVILIVIAGVMFSYLQPKYGKVVITFATTTHPTGMMSIKFNDMTVKSESTDSYEYSLKTGNYSLAISALGYKKFVTNFKLTANNDLNIYPNLDPLTNPSATNISNVLFTPGGTNYPTSVSSIWPLATVTAQYFDNNNWAILTVDTKISFGLAYLVVQYSPTLQKWVSISGPAVNLQTLNNLQSLPTDLRQYLISQGDTNAS